METTFENPAKTAEREQRIRLLDAHYCSRPNVIDQTITRLAADLARMDRQLIEDEGVSDVAR